MNYFTSDLHLGHRNIIRLCNRPFATIEEMDETLIRNWNAKVTNGDTVYILGDLLFRNEKPAEEYLKQLKGKKHLIIGNHDRDWVKKCNLEDFFESVNNLHFIMDEYDTIFVEFPIWWYIAPTIVNAFLESYDLTGKTIIPFATSGGSGMGKTNEALKPSCTGATLLEGKVWKSTAKKEELSVWADSLACR